jgi:CheY-like chemotaxis protein
MESTAVGLLQTRPTEEATEVEEACIDANIAATVKTVLVDDQDAPRAAISLLLRDRGFNCVAVRDATEFRTLMSREPRAFDVILADYHLGEGPSGTQLIAEAKERGFIRDDALVVVISGTVDEASIYHEIQQLGAVFLGKPFRSAKLLNLVITGLEEKRGFSLKRYALREGDFRKFMEFRKWMHRLTNTLFFASIIDSAFKEPLGVLQEIRQLYTSCENIHGKIRQVTPHIDEFIAGSLLERSPLDIVTEIATELASLQTIFRRCDALVESLPCSSDRQREAKRIAKDAIAEAQTLIEQCVRAISSESPSVDPSRPLPGLSMPTVEQVRQEVLRHDINTFEVISVDSPEARAVVAYSRSIGETDMANHLEWMADRGLVRAGPLEGFLACPFVEEESRFGQKDREYILVSNRYPLYNSLTQRGISISHEIGATRGFRRSHEVNTTRGEGLRAFLTVQRIERAQRYVESGERHWDRVVILTRDRFGNNAKPSLELHLIELADLYRHTDIAVWPCPMPYELEPREDGANPNTGEFDLALWAIKRLIEEERLDPKAKALIILDSGMSTRAFSVAAPYVGKGEVPVPAVYKGHLLELIDQVYIQSHMLLEDMPRDEGRFMVLSNDQLWALGEPARGNPDKHGIQVFGHEVDMSPVFEELVELGWLEFGEEGEIKIIGEPESGQSDDELMAKRLESFLGIEEERQLISKILKGSCSPEELSAFINRLKILSIYDFAIRAF